MITVDLPSNEALEAASSAFTFALVGIGLLIVGSAVAAATWARSLNSWALGGVSFVLSQTAQVVTLFLFGPLIAAFTSAPLQEASRAIILSTAARGVRDTRPSTAFGFGHGSIDLFMSSLILTSSYIPALTALWVLSVVRDGKIFIGSDTESIDSWHTIAAYLVSQGTITTAVALIVQGALMFGLHALLTLIVLRAVVRGGGVRAVGLGLLLPIAIHMPVAVVRTLFPAATLPVLLGALLVALLANRRGRGSMAEAAAGQ